MSWKEPLSEHLQELLPSNVISSREHRSQCGGPPDICTILKGKSSQRHLVLLRTAYGAEDLLSLPNPSFCNIWRTLPLKRRRPHPPEPLHHGGTMRTFQLSYSLLMGCWRCHASLDMSHHRSLSLRLLLQRLHKPWDSLKKSSQLWRRREIGLTSGRPMLLSSSSLRRCPSWRRRLWDISRKSGTASRTRTSHSNSTNKARSEHPTQLHATN